MQLSNAPGKLVLPFANSGAKNAIPVASQIGIVAGAASLTDGFPPLTRTPLAAGGVPPSGLDMNGIIYELSAILRWANAGAGYVYDGTFATDSNVGGYPKGARVLRSDGLGYWFNTTDNNTTDPEGAGAAAAGWVPDFTTGITAVTMTNANVTLTALQYGKPIIVISGLLTANLNLIFPNIVGEWTIINNCTGAFTVTCKTAAGTGVTVAFARTILGDGTNVVAANTDADVTAVSDPTFVDNSAKAASTSWIRNAMTTLAAAAGFTASFTAAGYIKFPSWLGGWVVQWGTVTTDGSGLATITFPLTFPTAPLGISLQDVGFAVANIDVFCSTLISTSQCSVACATNAGAAQSATAYYIAWGN